MRLNEYRNFCEFVKKPDKPKRSLRSILIICYTLITLAYIVFFYLMLKQWQLLILLPFLMYAIIALSWKYTDPEYEYAIEAGLLTVSVIYGGKTRRVKARADLTKALRISPFEERLTAGREVASVKELSAGGEVWCIMLPDSDRGRKSALVVSVDDNMKRIMKLCNPSATVNM